MSSNSNRSIDSINQRLERDAREIDDALSSFLSQRAEVSSQQAQALAAYEMEMLDIGDISDDEGDRAQIDGKGKGAQPRIDHNILRLTGKEGDGTVDLASDELDDEEFEYYRDELDDDNFGNSISNGKDDRKERAPKVEIRQPIPSAEAKDRLRLNLFSMLEDNHKLEDELERQLEDIRVANKDVDSDYPDKEYNKVADELFMLQKKSFIKVKKFVKDYQPHTSGNVWGLDPDYIKLTDKLKKLAREI
jgi:hypothetical protein